MIEQKIEQFWRDATDQDIAKVMRGEKVEARFRDGEGTSWYLRKLIGWNTGLFRCDRAEGWKLCQVYEPPQWWLDKPDPGEGWRLLEKFPGEPKLATDEFFDTFDNAWTQVGDTGIAQYYGVWYRRRIEPVKQDAGSTCASNIPKGWQYLSLDEPRLASDAFWSIGAKDWVLIGDSRVEYGNREKWPAIRQVETHKTMMLLEGCFYRLPNGQGIKVTKKGFDVF
jgi:hypothetical protein